jgi:type IX secretion system PorP/SprF family membrane protein
MKPTKKIKSYIQLASLAATLGTALPMATQAQEIDPHFSQFYETSILRNPGLTGIFSGDYKIGAQYRSQWNSISKPYQTGMVSAESRYAFNQQKNDFLSFGVLAYYDKAGSVDMATMAIYPAVNFNKSLEDRNNSFLSVGFTGGYIQRSFDATKVTTNSQYQNNSYNANNATGENFNKPSIANWDLGAGITYSSSTGDEARNAMTYYVGASGYHFTQPKNSFANDPAVTLGMRINVTAGMSIALNEAYHVQAHGNFEHQGSSNEVIAGGLLGWTQTNVEEEKAFGLFGGVFYRLGDAFIPVVKLKYRTYSFGASYDVTASKLTTANNLRGGFEIMAFKTGVFNNPDRQKSKVICPHSFW